MIKPSHIKPSPSATDYADVFVAAVEGGINYWAECSEYDWLFEPRSGNQDNDYAVVVITDIETREQWKIDSRSDKWHNAVAKAAELYGQSVDDFIEDHDAGSGDVAMQFAIFDKIVYG